MSMASAATNWKPALRKSQVRRALYGKGSVRTLGVPKVDMPSRKPARFWEYASLADDYLPHQVKRVKISTLRMTHPVDLENVAGKLKTWSDKAARTIRHKKATADVLDEFGVGRPIVAQMWGRNYVIQGNHRVAAMKAARKKSAWVDFVKAPLSFTREYRDQVDEVIRKTKGRRS